MTKSFLVLLALVLAWGVTIGGAFAGGVAFEKGQPTEGAAEAPRERAGAGQQPGGVSPAQSPPSQGREQPAGQRQPTTAEQQSPGLGGSGQGASGRAGRVLIGAIESVDGDTVTIDTPRGPIPVAVGESAAIRKVSDGVQADLTQGMRVAVLGQRGEDGKVAARAILVSPEGIQGFLGGGSGRGNMPRNRTGQ